MNKYSVVRDSSEGVLTGVVLRVSIEGAMKTRTCVSSNLYFAFPLTTCIPGGPVRRPPGK
jgi:hypothetical protein